MDSNSIPSPSSSAEAGPSLGGLARLMSLMLTILFTAGCVGNRWSEPAPGRATSSEAWLTQSAPPPPRPLPPLHRQQPAPSSTRAPSWPTRPVAASEPLPLGPAEIIAAEPPAVPIDLGKVLALAGATHLQVQIARERTLQAQADFDAARYRWLPTFRLGIAWNKHDGRLQATEGDVINRGRNSLFVGGGAGLGQMPLNGGAGGPPRLMVNFSLADAFFDPRMEEHRTMAALSGESSVINDALLSSGQAYVELVRSHGLLANARRIRESAVELAQTIAQFHTVGAAAAADVDRLNVEVAWWEQQAEDAERRTRVAAANLARQLRLDLQQPLVPGETSVVPWELVRQNRSLDEWIAVAWSGHPELTRVELLAAAEAEGYRKERWRPLLPNVQVGATAGTFGGGPYSTFDNQGSRSDVDLLAVWELENAGLGNRARRDRAASRSREAELQSQWVREGIAANLTAAYQDWQSYRRQLSLAKQAVETAERGYQRNRERIRAGEGLPVELVQSLRAFATALDTYTETVAQFNLAQLRLLHAAGVGLPDSNTAITSAAP